MCSKCLKTNIKCLCYVIFVKLMIYHFNIRTSRYFFNNKISVIEKFLYAYLIFILYYFIVTPCSKKKKSFILCIPKRLCNGENSNSPLSGVFHKSIKFFFFITSLNIKNKTLRKK